MVGISPNGDSFGHRSHHSKMTKAVHTVMSKACANKGTIFGAAGAINDGLISGAMGEVVLARTVEAAMGTFGISGKACASAMLNKIQVE